MFGTPALELVTLQIKLLDANLDNARHTGSGTRILLSFFEH